MGLGCDICNIERIEKVCANFGERFMKNYYSPREREEIEANSDEKKKIEALAMKFAAKEAFSKALGTGFSNGLAWSEIEVLHHESGKPYLLLSGKALAMAEKMGAKNYLVSLSDDYPLAQAVVIIEN